MSARAATGDAPFVIILDGETFEFAATVTSYVTGTVTRVPALNQAAVPANGQTIQLRDGTGRVTTANANHLGVYRFDGLMGGTYTLTTNAPEGFVASPSSRTVTLGGGAARQDFQIVPLAGAGSRRSGSVVIYKDHSGWFGNNKHESVLQNQLQLVRGTDYQINPLSALQSAIPASTSLIIFESNGYGYAADAAAVNNATAQANLDAWIQGGGWLVAAVGDNLYNDGYKIPGMTGKADEIGNCTGLTLTDLTHPFVVGPDRAPGTSDDLNNANIDTGGYCSHNHGSLAGILPAGATVLMTEQGGSQRPVYATYRYGAGMVVVTTLTIDFSAHYLGTMVNHLAWTIFSNRGAPAPLPALRAPYQDDPAAVAPWNRTDVPPPDVRQEGSKAAPLGSGRGSEPAIPASPPRAARPRERRVRRR